MSGAADPAPERVLGQCVWTKVLWTAAGPQSWAFLCCISALTVTELDWEIVYIKDKTFFFSVRFQVSFLALTTAWRDSISICMWCHCRRASHSSALAAFSASASLSILLLVPSSNYRGGTKDNIKNMQVTIIDCYIKMSGWNFCENCINVKFSVLYRGKGLIPLCLMGSGWPHLYPWHFVREEFSYKLPNCSETLLTSGVKGLRGGAEGSSFQVEIKCIDFNAFLISGFWVCFSFYPVKRSFLKPPLIVCGVILDLDLSLILICSCM